jgi:hypothetical protein
VLICKANQSLLFGIRRRGELAAVAMLQLVDLLLLALQGERSRDQGGGGVSCCKQEQRRKKPDWRREGALLAQS